MSDALKGVVARPESMKLEVYERTLRARAFDVARYLLPLATNTSLGQIVNARTLETQISRLLTSEFAEIRSLGEKLKEAAAAPVWNVRNADDQVLCQEIGSVDERCADLARTHLLREVKAAPTLVKYAAPNEYQAATRAELRQAAAELLSKEAILEAPVVDLIDDGEPLEVELAASLLYPYCHYPYRQVRDHVAALNESKRTEIIRLGARHRGRHDELLRSFSAGQALRFDILMDIGGFRDMHRHRRCVQLLQGYTDLHGYDLPECPGQPTLAEAGIEAEYTAAMESAFASYRALKASGIAEAGQSAQYLLPLGTRCRSLFKMDFAEAVYISELRTGSGGHFSYRRVAYAMYEAVAQRHPSLAEYFRVEDVREPLDLLRR